MQIRYAAIQDLPQIVKLGRSLLELHQEFDNDYYQLENNFDGLFGKWVEEQIINPNNLIIVAEDEQSVSIVGFISGFLKALYPWFITKSVGHISYLMVDPKYQKQGIGQKLEQEAISWFKAKNIKYIELYVEEINFIGLNAWSKYGFLPFKKFLKKKI